MDQMSKEEYYDALQYLYEHAYKCNDCEDVNIKCDACQEDNTMECDIAHWKLADIIENLFELKEENRKLKIALDNAIKECCINVNGSDSCNSLDELYKSFEKKVWENVK